MVTAISPRRGRPGIGLGAGLLAAARGVAFFGLMLAGLGLLLVLFAAVGLTAVGVGVLLADPGLPGIHTGVTGGSWVMTSSWAHGHSPGWAGAVCHFIGPCASSGWSYSSCQFHQSYGRVWG